VELSVSGFQWDAGNRDKCCKHGLSVPVIESLFAGPVSVFPDPHHSAAAVRFKAIGQTAAGRHVLIVFTLRPGPQGQRIRPISARFMHRPEVAYYEEAASRSEH
jgi:uncharacterized DUF497 family protein